ncbi:MAG TPA: cyclopropane-fatty-acyl-phospholipid synthase family protein [Caulobacteraceae bacterium]|jgi:cyclopropane-fatty-acyl-phospholipid synthase|nr:cyclopropane-fatty-acyl-phospholipid synthase family protein [Caulobacteraceae bacterium]
MGLEAYLRRVIREGGLELNLPGGGNVVIGDEARPKVAVTLRSPIWAARILANPEVAVGDAYMDGALVLERGDIYDLLELAGRNQPARKRPPPSAFARWRHDMLATRNARRQARRNVQAHYDVSNTFYRRFLDADLQYSCAYFTEPGLSLEDAQRAKQRHIEAKLLLRPGQKVLDIGCGWGGLALRLAADAGVQVEGVTLSTEQLDLARRRAEESGLHDRVGYALTDYRDVAGPYDRIVSVGMFEHVGRPNYAAYFGQIARLLKDEGVAVVHSIGRFEGPDVTQPWIAKHIFPGGYIPALSEALAAVERSGLMVTDVEILRLHYAETLRAWRRRFAAQRHEVAATRGERFCRMWEFYLAASEIGFRYGGHMVFQLQLAKRIDAVPLTRNYIQQTERDLAEERRTAA